MTLVKIARKQFIEHWEELTLTSGDAAFENPFAPQDEDDMEFVIRQKVVGTPAAESFSAAISGSANETITVSSSNASSTVVVRVIVKGNYGS